MEVDEHRASTQRGVPRQTRPSHHSLTQAFVTLTHGSIACSAISRAAIGRSSAVVFHGRPDRRHAARQRPCQRPSAKAREAAAVSKRLGSAARGTAQRARARTSSAPMQCAIQRLGGARVVLKTGSPELGHEKMPASNRSCIRLQSASSDGRRRSSLSAAGVSASIMPLPVPRSTDLAAKRRNA